MKIGSLELANPFILAPMAGITDGPFRLICKEFGASLVYSEMVSVKGLYYKDESTERLLNIYPGEKPIAFQIFGSDPKFMALATEKLEDRENVIIDINMGCPVQKVIKNGDGSALLTNPKQAAEVVRAVVQNTKKPVTVKIRIGWDKDSINALEIAKIIESEGASAISVHGRTRDQFYNGEANWDMIRQVKENIKIPVIGSGDIFSGADAIRMMQETGCDFVMIARGALGNPWIFKEAISYYNNQDQRCTQPYDEPFTQALQAKPGLDEKYDLIKRHFDLVIAEKGEDNGVREMRKHIGWYLKGVHGSCEIRRKINSMKDSDEVRLLLNSLKTLK